MRRWGRLPLEASKQTGAGIKAEANPVAIMPVTTSIAAVCTPTAASAGISEFDAVISRAGAVEVGR
jgi:hypothetical protein